MGSYTPDSEDSFKLLDKETSIKDAVAFFKNYVDNLPCSIEPYFSINVNNVQVYKVEEGLYCYQYTTSKKYDEIPFDYSVSGSSGGRGNSDLGIGAMIKSSDVDFIYGTFKLSTVIEEKEFPFKETVPFEKAVRIVFDKMTDYVKFEVIAAQLVYCTNDDIGNGMLGGTKEPVFPAYKLTLYNPNDHYYYLCFVNALDEAFEKHREDKIG